MPPRLPVMLLLAGLPALCGDWDPKLAASFMDARQKEWFAWPNAKDVSGLPCLSCHTGLSYMLARPVLRGALKESAPTEYESGLLDALRKRVAKRTPQQWNPAAKEPGASQALGVEAILSSLLLAQDDARRGSSMSRDTEQAFDRLWSLQLPGGAWNWNSLELDPYEEPESAFFGASLAALAVGTAPGSYQSRADIRASVASLKAYLAAQEKSQPLHNRLVLVWASSKLKGALPEGERKAIIKEAFEKQQPDGGWTLQALGEWRTHPDAPPAQGSNAYATGLAAFALQQAGVSRGDRGLARALDWLRSHQDRTSGFWEAPSMNKRRDPATMPAQFMRDAATAYASLALAER